MEYHRNQDNEVLSRPIIVVGAPRSGTKLLPLAIRRHPDIAFWDEPNYIWRHGNAHLPHDMIPSSAATPDVVRRIRGRFKRFVDSNGGSRFAEKTPANALRLGFVLSVFPDAKIIHVVRDGRDVVMSALKQWRRERAPEATFSGESNLSNFVGRIRQRIETQAIPLQDLPYYIPRFVGALLNRAGVTRTGQWGSRFPGMASVVRSHSLLEVTAMQWRWSVDCVLNHRASNPSFDFYQVRYEDLSVDPEAEVKKVFDFAELSVTPEVQDGIARIRSGNAEKWRGLLVGEDLDIVQSHIGHTLQTLGYDL